MLGQCMHILAGETGKFASNLDAQGESHCSATSAVPMSPAACLPTSLQTPDRPQYRFQPHVAGKQRGEKQRLKLDEPEAETSHTAKNSYF